MSAADFETVPRAFAMDVGEIVDLSFDFSTLLPTSTTLSSATVTATERDSGASASSILSGAASLTDANTKVQQRIASVANNTAYKLKVLGTFSDGQKRALVTYINGETA